MAIYKSSFNKKPEKEVEKKPKKEKPIKEKKPKKHIKVNVPFVTLLVFSFLFIVCVMPNNFLKSFILGMFGLTIYAVCVIGIFFSIMFLMKKKSNGEGSIVKRTDGRYMARYTMEGKRYAIYGTSHEEVRVQLTEVLGNIDKGAHIAPSGYTVSQWLREWLITYALPTVKQSTYIS